MRNIRVEILGVGLEAALLNHKVARRYDEGLKKVAKIADSAKGCANGADGIEMQCDAVINFMDDIFGHGSAKNVLGEETDLLTCLEAFEELADVYDKQVNPLLEEHNNEVQRKIEAKNGDTQ